MEDLADGDASAVLEVSGHHDAGQVSVDLVLTAETGLAERSLFVIRKERSTRSQVVVSGNDLVSCHGVQGKIRDKPFEGFSSFCVVW